MNKLNFNPQRINPNICYPGRTYIKFLAEIVWESGYYDHALMLINGVDATNTNVSQSRYDNAYYEAMDIATEYFNGGMNKTQEYKKPSYEEFKLPGHLLIQQSQWKKNHADLINRRLSNYYKTGM